MNILISIILINYNGYKDTIECISSLKKIKYNNYRIIIVDNCSTDNSIDKLNNYIDGNEKIILIRNTENNGFAGGNNIGIKHAMQLGTDYVLLLNNDTEVEENFICELIKPFEEYDNVGITTSKMMYYSEKNRVWFGGGHMDWTRFRGEHENYKLIDDFNDNIREITFATGCCMLIKNEVIKNVGLLPEEYFMYFEDLDYCLKVQENSYRIIYNPNSVIYHKVSSSSGGEESEFYIKWATRNRLILLNKYKNKISKLDLYKAKAFIYISRVVKILQFIITGKIKKAIAIIRGMKLARNFILNSKA